MLTLFSSLSFSPFWTEALKLTNTTPRLAALMGRLSVGFAVFLLSIMMPTVAARADVVSSPPNPFRTNQNATPSESPRTLAASVDVTASVALASGQDLPLLPVCKTYEKIKQKQPGRSGNRWSRQQLDQAKPIAHWDDSIVMVTDEEEVAPGTLELPVFRSEMSGSAFDQTMLGGLTLDIRPRTVEANAEKSQDKQGGGVGDLATKIPENLAASKLGDYQKAEIQLPGMGRGLGCREFAWAAPSFFHRPLYFEQHNLERYGHFYGGRCLQSVISSAHFFASVPLMPYKVAAQSPRECVYTLGNYRPGNCNPNYWTHCKLSARGFAAQAIATTGWAFLLY